MCHIRCSARGPPVGDNAAPAAMMLRPGIRLSWTLLHRHNDLRKGTHVAHGGEAGAEGLTSVLHAFNYRIFPASR